MGNLETNLFMNKVYAACEWIVKLILLNLLWLFFSLCGLVVLGIFPATVAMFAVIRKWVQKKSDHNFTKVFFATYKKEFWKANLFGLVFSLMGLALYLDSLYIRSFEGALSFYLFCLLIMICLIYLAMLLFFFPMYVHLEMPFISYFKQITLLILSRPIETVVMVGSFLIVSFFLILLPGLILFMGSSLVSLIVMANAYRTFHKVSIS